MNLLTICEHMTDIEVSILCDVSSETPLHPDIEKLGFTLCGLSVEPDSDAFFHPFV